MSSREWALASAVRGVGGIWARVSAWDWCTLHHSVTRAEARQETRPRVSLCSRFSGRSAESVRGHKLPVSARTVTRVTSDWWLYKLTSIKVRSHHPSFPLFLMCSHPRSLMLGSQMRLPVSGLTGSVSSLPLASPRHFGSGAAGGAQAGGDMEASIQSWRDNFLNKYHEQAREVSTEHTSKRLPPFRIV